MPVIQIQSLPQAASVKVSEVLEKLCRAVSTECGCPLEYISATWQFLEGGAYAEAGVASATQPRSTHPVIVHLTCYEMEAEREIQKYLKVCGKFLEANLNLKGNVFIVYSSASAGRVYSGGAVV